MCGSRRLRFAGNVEGFSFVECTVCSFVFTPAIAPPDAENRYRRHQEGEPAQGWADESFLVPALEALGAEKPLYILDFGAGESRVPDLLRARGHRVIAVDLVPPIRPHPDRLTGPLETLDLPAGRFDLIYSFQVFEHLPQPAPILRRLLRLLRSGGLLLIHTDMEVAERPKRFSDWWYVLPPHHCSFYRHRTFDVFCRRTPHRVAWRDEKSVMIQAGHPTRTIGVKHGK